MDIQKYIELAKENFREYEYYGLRFHQGQPVEVGETLPNSFVWDDGICTEEELNGTCAINLCYPHIDRVSNDYVTLGDAIIIAGNFAEYGEDPGEIIIKDAIRIA